MMAEAARTPNAAQLRRWNGEGGQFWIIHRERHLAGHRSLLPHLFGAAAISPGTRVLDVGCGCGETTITAARAGGGVIGLDLSGPMLDVARRLAAQAGVENARFVRGDAQICPLRPGSGDVVISSFGVMFFDDPAAAFAGLATTLRRGGRLAFLCWQHDLQNEVFGIPVRAFDAYMSPAPPADGGLFVDPRRIAALLSGTGWEDIGLRPISEPAWMGSDVGDVMSYIRSMPRIRGLVADLGDEAVLERVMTAVAGEYAARARPDGVWVQAAAWLVTARRG
jgi:SAM-dependent methyltransferase